VQDDICQCEKRTYLEYTSWSWGQPSNNGGNEACINLCAGLYYDWNDENCAREFCAICEIDLPQVIPL